MMQPQSGLQEQPSKTETPAPPPERPRTNNTILILLVVATLGAGVLVTARTSNVTKASEAGVRLVNGLPFLPESAGDWKGSELQGISDAEKKVLPADTEAARRIYTNQSGREVYCSLVLAGRDVTSIHRPELCLPGQGWSIEQEQTESIATEAAQGGRLKVTRIDAAQSLKLPNGQVASGHAVFIYWFVGKGRVTPYHWQRILWTAKDRVLHNTNHRWAYFLMYTPIKKVESPRDLERGRQEAMQSINQFVQAIYPQLVAKDQ